VKKAAKKGTTRKQSSDTIAEDVSEKEVEVVEEKPEKKQKQKKATPEEEEKSDGPKDKSQALMLVDGNAVLHACFWATFKYDLKNEKGEPTGAILGFINLIRRLRREVQHSHFVILWDSKDSKSSRKEALPEYKGNRKETPDDLKQQFIKAKQLCDAFGWTCKEAPGYEADDLIHTYAESASKQMVVRVFSPDKDLAQLVGPDVFLHRNTKKPTEAMDEDAVVKKWGVRPEQLGDYLAMAGDASDCVPGVPNIGSVSAATLLQNFQTLDGVIKAAENDEPLGPRLGKRVRDSLVDHQEQARKMRGIVALQTVPKFTTKKKYLDEFRTPKLDEKWLDRAMSFCEQENLQVVAKDLGQQLLRGELVG